jgi:imidazolonepropionase
MEFSEPFDSLYLNAHLATMAGSDEYGIVEDGAIAVDDGRIQWLGPVNELPSAARSNAGGIEDLDAAWVTPGLVDCHTHLVYAGNRSNEFEMRLKGADYQAIAKAGGGITSTVRAVRAAEEAEIFEQSKPRLQDMLADGITTLEVKSGYGLDLKNELKLLKVIKQLSAQTPARIRATFLGAHTVPPEYQGRPDDYVQLIITSILPEVAKQNLASAVDVFCETIGFTLDQTERIFQAARERGLAIKLHAEQLSDSKGAVLAARYQALSVDHLEYLDPGDVPALAKGGCVAVLLPGAFYYLNETQKPPIQAMRSASVPMAVSTDANPGTSPVLSIRSMMNMVCVLFGLTPAEALAGVTRYASQALGLQDEIGTLEVGKFADFAVWDVSSPADLAYQLGGNPLVFSVMGGQKYDPIMCCRC